MVRTTVVVSRVRKEWMKNERSLEVPYRTYVSKILFEYFYEIKKLCHLLLLLTYVHIYNTGPILEAIIGK